MKIKHLLLSAIAVATALVSCQKDLSKETASISLSDAEINFESTTTDKKTITLSSTRTWIAEIPAAAKEWVTVSPDKGEASADPQTIEITVKDNSGNDRSADITFKIVGGSQILKVNQKGDQGAAQPGDGSLEHPYKASEARAIAAALGANETTDNVYVKGIVHKIKSIDTGKYGNAEYYISDDGNSSENDLPIFRGYYFNGDHFSSSDQLKVGDAVVVYGQLTNYVGDQGRSTPQMAQGSKLITINGSEGKPAETASDEGLVMATSTSGFIFKTNDATKYAFDAEATKEVKVGDIITLKGTLGEHVGLPQYTNCTVEVKSSGNTVTYPAPTVLTNDNIGNYNEAFGYVKMSGKLTKSGKYYNIATGLSKNGSLSYAEVDAQYIDKYVDVEGYYVGLSGGYFNIVYTKIAQSDNQPEEETPGAGSIVLTFPDENSANSNKINNYTSTWTAKKEGVEFEIANFNNNKWGWTYIKCGRKSDSSVASIATKTAIPVAIDRVVLDCSKWNQANLNSAKLYVYSDAALTTEVCSADIVQNGLKYQAVVSQPAANLYYKVVLDCKADTSSDPTNGYIQLEKFILWVNAK